MALHMKSTSSIKFEFHAALSLWFYKYIDIFWIKSLNGTFIALHMKTLDSIKFEFHAGV